MKTQLILTALILFACIKLFSQEDTSKVRITFITPHNQAVNIYEQVYVGDFETQGYNPEIGTTYQYGTLTRKEFLFNAPGSNTFQRDRSIVLIMSDNNSIETKFCLDTRFNNQKWLLTPSGKDFRKGHGLIILGITGILMSTIMYTGIIIRNNYETSKYNMDMDFYNKTQKMFANSPFPIPQTSSPPQKPRKIGYFIPTISLGFSITTLIRGSILTRRNAPSAIRIE